MYVLASCNANNRREDDPKILVRRTARLVYFNNAAFRKAITSARTASVIWALWPT